jgi:hypothetical protein
MSETEREKLVSEGATTQGMVMHSESSATDRRMTQVRVSVRFKDGQTAEFSEELANLYQPAPGSQEAQRLAEVRGAEQLRHPDRIPKIQLPLSDGAKVPVRYDAADLSKIVIDVPALQKRALHDYIQREQRPKGQAATPPAARTGPPWTVPTHCLNCGAPVDQAKASQDPDPMCQFCDQPIPVTPLRLTIGHPIASRQVSNISDLIGLDHTLLLHLA